MKLKSLLEERDVFILDGAMGTALEARGEELHPILWSAGHLITKPEIIASIHREYALAGADIITSATYQISQRGLSQNYSYTLDQTLDMIRFGNDLARQATKSIAGCLVASSVGCYGAHLANGSEFCGRYGLSTLELVDWHKAKWTAHCTADLIACETIPCLAEVKALVSIIGSYEGELNGWISMSCQSGQLLNSGDSIEDACRALEDLSSTSEHNLRYLGLGINCSSPEIVEEALLCMQEHCRRGRPLVAYPNKGEPWDAVAKCYDASKGFSPQSFASLAVRWKEAGARVIGGCCRTDHVFTRALRQRLCIDEGNT